jgi:FKBP-type peptidyl-prolyl cis-trans isomerase
MKTIFLSFLLIFVHQISFAQNDSLTKTRISQDLESLRLSSADDSTNYAAGMIFAKQLEAFPNAITIDNILILKGFLAARQDKAILTDENLKTLVMEIFVLDNILPATDTVYAFEEEIPQTIKTPISEEEKVKITADEMAFFAENGEKNGIMTLASGIQYELIVGNDKGANPQQDDYIQVFYFSEYKKNDGQMTKVQFSQNIHITSQNQKWQEIYQRLKVGNTYRFYLPSEYASSAPATFANENEIIVLDIELINIKNDDEDDGY